MTLPSRPSHVAREQADAVMAEAAIITAEPRQATTMERANMIDSWVSRRRGSIAMAVVIGLPAERVERAVTGSEDTRRGPKFASADRRTHVVGMRPAPRTFHDALNRLFTGDAAPMKAIWSHGDDVV